MDAPLMSNKTVPCFKSTRRLDKVLLVLSRGYAAAQEGFITFILACQRPLGLIG